MTATQQLSEIEMKATQKLPKIVMKAIQDIPVQVMVWMIRRAQPEHFKGN